MPTQSPSRYFAFLVVLLSAVFIFTLLSFNQEAAASHHILYVNAAADPGGNGSSWENAFTDLQDALADATIGDEIWVAAGLYKPTDDPTDREASFYLQWGVALYGGFTGTETARDQRDWETNLTVLSGDIDDNDLTDPAGVVTNTVNISGTNSYHVVVGGWVNETAVLDGFTITAGQADGLFPHGSGGGMLNDNSHPRLANVTFIGNVASFGGGMANVTDSSPTLTTVTFSGNSALQGGGMGNGDSNPGLTDVTFIGNNAIFGGGMGNQNSNPSLTNVTFIGNSVEDSEGGGGGGMSNFESNPSLSNVTFSDNSADDFGGGMFGYASSPTLTDVIFNDNSTDGFGGGMFNEESSSPILNNVLFNGNSAAAGGGMANFVGSNSALTNVVFSDNSVDGLGGGMYNYYSQPTVTDGSFDGNTTDNEGAGGGMFNYVSHSTLTNVSFSNNSAHSGGGIGNYNSSPTLTNVSFDGNNAASGGGMSNLSYDENGVYSFPGRINNFIGSNPALTNVTFTGNIADTGGGMANTASNPILTNVVFSSNIAIYGGGMANTSDDNNMGSNPTLTNVTFSGNIGSFGGGLHNEDDSDPLIQNSIFWLNQDLSGLGTPDASIYNDNSTPAIRYSLVQGCNPHGEWVSQCGTDSGSNLADADPLFVENPDSAETPMTAGNLRLQPDSPAIDAGNNEYVAGVATDLDGNPRIMGTAVDLGPYELDACATNSILCVDQAAAGANDGSSWADAFNDLQDALAAAVPGNEIWVAAAVYKPTDDPTDRQASFYLTDGVAVYGGFAGWETIRDQRDWENNLTVLSGDIDNNDITDSAGVVTDTANIMGANSYHVVVGSGVTETAVLDGFIITAGKANGFSFHNNNTGGGLYSNNSNYILTNIIFNGNYGTLGGGMYNANGSPILTNVTFNANHGHNAGGLFNVFGSHTILTNVTFSNNLANIEGGGMFNSIDSSPILTNIIFNGNRANSAGGGMKVFHSSPTLVNVTFSGNYANNAGGMHSTLSNLSVQNSLFWNNQDSSGVGTAAASIQNEVETTTTVRYSLVQGCNPGDVWVNDCGTDGGNNLADADPLFIETPDPAEAPTSDGNLRLQPGSPAIDAGNDVYVVDVPTDLDGNPRLIGPAVDLGPYEANAYLLTVGVVGDGSITADPLQSSYLYGEVVTVTAVPDPGWVFLTWSGDLSGSANPATITMDANKTVMATMEQEIAGVAAVNSSPTTLGQTTFFTATASGGTNIEYLWSFGDGPDSSGQHANHVYSAAGVYTATLTASNGAGSMQATTSVTITNDAPIAHAGPDQTTEVNQPVMLDGSGSFDPDGHEPLAYGWSQTGGPTVSLSDPTAAQPTFTTPSVGSVLTLTLVVSDSFGLAGDPDAVVVTVRQPAITIGKTANPPSAGVGDTITYTYRLTNTGDVALSQVNPIDDRLGPLFTAPISLTVGQMISQTLTYTVVEADLPGPLLNTVVVSGTSPLGSMVTDSDMAVVLLSSQPAIYIFKEASVASAGINEVITYTYTVMNVGDVTLTGVTAVDDQLGSILLLTDTLPSLASTSGVLTYTVSESDLPGPLINTVTASGTPPVGSPVTATAALSLPLTSSPALEVALTAVPSLARPGATITYSLSLTNSGDITLHNLSSTVTVAGGFTLPDSLAPGIALTVAYSYTVTTADRPGPLTNTVTITAVPTANEPMTVTTAVATHLEPHAIYLPLIINSVAASAAVDSWPGHGGN